MTARFGRFLEQHDKCFSKGIGVQVARCTKIIKPGTEEAKYVINVKQIAKVRPSHSFLSPICLSLACHREQQSHLLARSHGLNAV